MFNPTNVGGALVFWGVLGAVVSPAALKPAAARSRGAVVLATAALVAALLCLASAVPMVIAARTASVLNDPTIPPSVQLAAALRAATLNPLEADYRAGAAQAEADLLVETAYANPADKSRISGLLSASLAHAREALRMQPETALRRNMQTGLLLLGAQYVDQTLYAQALDAASETAEEMPFELTALYWNARALYESGDVQGAEAILTRALGIRPVFPGAALLLADILADSGRTNKALEVLDRADPTGVAPAIQEAIQGLRTAAP
jgi:tetratricopeptide (TPR) repeat protein